MGFITEALRQLAPLTTRPLTTRPLLLEGDNSSLGIFSTIFLFNFYFIFKLKFKLTFRETKASWRVS